MSEDPIGSHSGDNNFYNYVGNNPTNNTDTSGNLPVPILFCPTLGSCPGSILRCLVGSGIFVEPDEAQNWSAQCEQEIEDKKKPKQCNE